MHIMPLGQSLVPQGLKRRAQQSNRQSYLIPRIPSPFLRNNFAAAVKFLSKVIPPFLPPLRLARYPSRSLSLSLSIARVRRNSLPLPLSGGYNLLQGLVTSSLDLIGIYSDLLSFIIRATCYLSKCRKRKYAIALIWG